MTTISIVSWILWVRVSLYNWFFVSDTQITLGKPVLRGPSISLLTAIEEFYCKLENITTNQTILYKLFKEGNSNKTLGEYSAHSQEEAKFDSYIDLAYDGRLICKASVQNNSEISPTFSDGKVFKVVGKLIKK